MAGHPSGGSVGPGTCCAASSAAPDRRDVRPTVSAPRRTDCANLVPLNTADNWVHLLLGVGMIGLGLLGRRSSPATR
ncbi:MAG: DUF4383 domain-containing protein [Micromonosporaceae bacterium]